MPCIPTQLLRTEEHLYILRSHFISILKTVTDVIEQVTTEGAIC